MKKQWMESFGRRSFLKLAGITAGSALASGCAAPLLGSQTQPISTAKMAAMSMPETATSTSSVASAGAAVNVKPFQVYNPVLPAVDPAPVKTVAFESSDIVEYIAKDVAFQAWTFGGSAPGPVLVLNEGDEVQFSLTNKSIMAHSIDFHAAQTPPSKNYVAVQPQATLKFNWKASVPGCFMYHCGTPYILDHMASGMYGATIVKPKTGLRAADREFVIVQSEFYVSEPINGVSQTDLQKALNGIPDYVNFNGYANQYQDNPLTAKVGELIRIWIMNAGPSHFSAFHVIGTIFEAAYQTGNPANKMVGIQTVNVYPGSGMMVELTIPEAGSYPFVTHSFADASKGALGVLAVTNS